LKTFVVDAEVKGNAPLGPDIWPAANHCLLLTSVHLASTMKFSTAIRNPLGSTDCFGLRKHLARITIEKLGNTLDLQPLLI
jgi:hypothetical protein